jgi:Ca2+-binding RTX toxin-like protein
MRLATPALMVAVLLFLFAAGAAFAAPARCVDGKPCFGTGEDDHMTGTGGNDEILARGGRDFVDGRGGSDIVRGGPGADGDEYVAGGLFGDSPGMSTNSVRDGDDEIYGDGGRDTLYGFGGSDLLVGGGRADYIFAGEFRFGMGRPGFVRSKNPGVDTVSAGAGGDHIEAVDNRRDVIDCGGGKDAVWFDEGLDVVASNCELKNIIHSGG